MSDLKIELVNATWMPKALFLDEPNALNVSEVDVANLTTAAKQAKIGISNPSPLCLLPNCLSMEVGL